MTPRIALTISSCDSRTARTQPVGRMSAAGVESPGRVVLVEVPVELEEPVETPGRVVPVEVCLKPLFLFKVDYILRVNLSISLFYIRLVSFLDFLWSLLPYDKHEYRNFMSCKSGKQVATKICFNVEKFNEYAQ